MKTIITLLLLIPTIIFAESSIVTLEKEDIFGALGYVPDEMVVLNVSDFSEGSGDFGEGGGGYRPIKSIKEGGICDDEITYYYPRDYRIELVSLTSYSLSKIPIPVIKFFNIKKGNELKKISMGEVFSFDLEFNGVVDFNFLTLEKVFSLVTIDGDVLSTQDLHSVEIQAIIEP